VPPTATKPMRTSILSALVSICWLAAGCAYPARLGSTPPSIPNIWIERTVENLLAARLRAALEGKFVLVDIVSDCNHCRASDVVMWDDESVRKWTSTQCIVLHVDMLRSEGLVEALRVTESPTNVLLRSDGTELVRIAGTRAPRDFHAVLRAHADLGQTRSPCARALNSFLERTDVGEVRVRVTAADTGTALESNRLWWSESTRIHSDRPAQNGFASFDQWSGTHIFTPATKAIELTVEPRDCRYEIVRKHVDLNAGPNALEIQLPRATGIQLDLRDSDASLPIMHAYYRPQWSFVAIDALGVELGPRWNEEFPYIHASRPGTLRLRFDRVPSGYSKPSERIVHVTRSELTQLRIEFQRRP